MNDSIYKKAPKGINLDLDSLKVASVQKVPFTYVVVKNFIQPDIQELLREQFPLVSIGGSMPLPIKNIERPIFMQVLEGLKTPEFRSLVEEKLGVSLEGTDFEVTTRSHARPGDGYIHPDSRSKVVSGLIYMEKDWPHGSKGALRMLNSATDVNDYATEITPRDGTLLLFRRSENSFHGYQDNFDAPVILRRTIQFNWYYQNRLKAFQRVTRLTLKRLEASVALLRRS